jgi:polyphenol oxidase
MYHFTAFEEEHGVLAVLSEQTDGDCSGRPEAVAARRRFLKRCGVDPGAVTFPRQVHGAHAALLPAAAERPEADAVAAFDRGIPLCITVADCVPVYIVAPSYPAAALVHAGREGTRQAIAGRVAAGLVDKGVAPGRMHALIGPSAGPCCYEVDAAMAGACARDGIPVQGRKLDLWAANRQQLVQAGIPEKQIAISGICTICTDRFYSLRREKTPARNLALLLLPAAA